MTGSAKGQALILVCPDHIDRVDHVRRVCDFDGKSIVMRGLACLVPENFKLDFEQVHRRDFMRRRGWISDSRSPVGLVSVT